jgi:hypothetical protein
MLAGEHVVHRRQQQYNVSRINRSSVIKQLAVSHAHMQLMRLWSFPCAGVQVPCSSSSSYTCKVVLLYHPLLHCKAPHVCCSSRSC